MKTDGHGSDVSLELALLTGDGRHLGLQLIDAVIGVGQLVLRSLASSLSLLQVGPQLLALPVQHPTLALSHVERLAGLVTVTLLLLNLVQTKELV